MDKQAELAIASQTLQTELGECRRVTEVLRSELDLSTAILNTVNAIAVVFDPEGHIVRCNRACEQTTGYTEDEVRNQAFWELFLTQGKKEPVKAIFDSIQVDTVGDRPPGAKETQCGTALATNCFGSASVRFLIGKW